MRHRIWRNNRSPNITREHRLLISISCSVGSVFKCSLLLSELLSWWRTAGHRGDNEHSCLYLLPLADLRDLLSDREPLLYNFGSQELFLSWWNPHPLRTSWWKPALQNSSFVGSGSSLIETTRNTAAQKFRNICSQGKNQRLKTIRRQRSSGQVSGQVL